MGNACKTTKYFTFWCGIRESWIFTYEKMRTLQKHWMKQLPAEHNYSYLGSFVTLKCLIMFRNYINCSNDATTHHTSVGNRSAYEEF